MFNRVNKHCHLTHKQGDYECYRYQHVLSVYHLSWLLNNVREPKGSAVQRPPQGVGFTLLCDYSSGGANCAKTSAPVLFFVQFENS